MGGSGQAVSISAGDSGPAGHKELLNEEEKQKLLDKREKTSSETKHKLG